MKYIHPFSFLLSLAIGLFIVYISTAPPNIIVVYPTPDNYNKFQYKDAADNCFVIRQDEIPCPDNEDNITTVQIQ